MSQPSLTAINDVGNATERLAAFLDAWREIAIVRARAEQTIGQRYALALDTYRAEEETAARFGIAAGDIQSAGRVLAKLVDG